MKKHWAYALIGHPWTPEENCWWLVQRVFQEQHGVEIPHLTVSPFGDIQNVTAIKQTATAIGFRPADGPCRAGDIVLMRGPLNERHVGVMIESKRGDLVLHSSGYMTDTGPKGSVVAEPLRAMLAAGYREIECWRKE